MRVVITGATGFLGRRVVPRLCAGGHDVIALVRNRQTVWNAGLSRLQTVEADLQDTPTVQAAISAFEPEACVHLAWQGIPDFSDALCLTNLLTSMNLFKALADGGTCRKVLVSGSCFEYGRTVGACRESDSIEVPTVFAWAKHASHLYGALLGRQRNMDLVWFRIFYLYGPGQRSAALIPSLVASLQNGVEPTLKNPYCANDFVYVDDVASAFAAALAKDIPSGIYNLGSGEAIAVNTVRNTVARLVRADADAVRPASGTAGQDAVRFWSDQERTASALGWIATTDLESGIRQYMAALEA